MITEDKQDNKVFGTRREWKIGNGTTTNTVDNKRFLLNGTFMVVALKNSAKFNPEIQLQVFNKNLFEEQPRGNNNGTWNRGEIYFGIEQIDNLIKALQEAKEYSRKD